MINMLIGIIAMIVAVLIIQLVINHDQRTRLERLERWASSLRAVSREELRRDLMNE